MLGYSPCTLHRLLVDFVSRRRLRCIVMLSSRDAEWLQESGGTEPTPIPECHVLAAHALRQTHREVESLWRSVATSALDCAVRFRLCVGNTLLRRVACINSFFTRGFGRPLSVAGGRTFQPPRSRSLRAIFHEPSDGEVDSKGGFSPVVRMFGSYSAVLLPPPTMSDELFCSSLVPSRDGQEVDATAFAS